MSCRSRASLSSLVIAITMASGAACGDPLISPQICSAIDAGNDVMQRPFCSVAPLAERPGQHELTLALSATSGPINVGGYRVTETDNYNDGYLPPVVELKPGDRLKVRLLNALAAPGGHDASGHMMGKGTNLHTHGLIVSPKNARAALPQNGDNIFVNLARGQSMDYSIDLPTALPASVLDGKSGIIPHPSGPFWYHSHQHGISASQVAGGMSGLMSIGPRDVNLTAKKPDDTAGLKAATDTSYLMLRDIQITSAVDPASADGNAPADWTPVIDSTLCERPADHAVSPAVEQRLGYCQSPQDSKKLWLFTVNGQRFPTIRVPTQRNNLWRVANLSANVTYVLSLVSDSGAVAQMDLISVDGIVPGVPAAAGAPAGSSPDSIKVQSLRLLPAARAELFIANDGSSATDRRLVLRTEGLDTAAPGEKGDRWPEVKLAEVILEGAPVVAARAVDVGLNVALAQPALQPKAIVMDAVAPPLPKGCVRDIDKVAMERRRITFLGSGGDWKISTEIVKPKDPTKLQPPSQVVVDSSATLKRVKFEQYLTTDHVVDWDGQGDGSDSNVRPRHTCVRLINGHGQLWELRNVSGELHNFHLHQTKFRLARDEDFRAYGIEPPEPATSGLGGKGQAVNGADEKNVWHDTLPLDPGRSVFIVINFDAEEQLGRYVFHCHILRHEDDGLMAPIEVVR